MRNCRNAADFKGIQKNVTFEHIYSPRLSFAFIAIVHSSASCHELHQLSTRYQVFFLTKPFQ